MKLTFLHALAAGFALSIILAATAIAGSAVATDNHGGFGYSFGDYSRERLEREAIHHCREKSQYPDDVHVVVSSAHRGSGIIVRYTVDGRPHIYAYVGATDDGQAYDYATGYVEGYGGRKIEVMARWRD